MKENGRSLQSGLQPETPERQRIREIVSGSKSGIVLTQDRINQALGALAEVENGQEIDPQARTSAQRTVEIYNNLPESRQQSLMGGEIIVSIDIVGNQQVEPNHKSK